MQTALKPVKQNIPFGLCHCGCGNPAPISTRSHAQYGFVKGQPKRFMPFHSRNLINYQSKLPWLTEAIRVNSDDCLLWPFYTNIYGYGMLRFEGRMVHAHRVSFYLTYGHWPTPEGCHKCDNPTCFNPLHIFEGTRKDNCVDAAAKGRCANTKLSAASVGTIRREYVRGRGIHSAEKLATKYGVSPGTIRKIVRRFCWVGVA